MHKKIIFRVCLIILPAILLSSFFTKAYAKPKKSNEIKITLFGSPCTLSGPFEEKVLQAIHSVSPEQIPQIASASQSKETLAKIAKTTVPSMLEGYLSKLKKRLTLQQTFFEALDKSKTSTDAKDLNPFATQYVKEQLRDEFQKLALAAFPKIAVSASPATKPTEKIIEDKDPDTVGPQTPEEQLIAFVDLLIEDPQEDFHLAIKKIKVQYNCSFEEMGI